MNKRGNTKNMVVASLFAALIMIFTAYVKVNTGINNGYLHFGDSMIYLAACLVPGPYALGAAAVGGALADVLAGAAVWAPVTAVIKALNVLPFALVYKTGLHKDKYTIMSMATALSSIISGAVTILGYLAAETLLYGFSAACMTVPFSIVQAAGSTVVFCAAAFALDCAKFKKRVNN